MFLHSLPALRRAISLFSLAACSQTSAQPLGQFKHSSSGFNGSFLHGTYLIPRAINNCSKRSNVLSAFSHNLHGLVCHSKLATQCSGKPQISRDPRYLWFYHSTEPEGPSSGLSKDAVSYGDSYYTLPLPLMNCDPLPQTSQINLSGCLARYWSLVPPVTFSRHSQRGVKKNQ